MGHQGKVIGTGNTGEGTLQLRSKHRRDCCMAFEKKFSTRRFIFTKVGTKYILLKILSKFYFLTWLMSTQGSLTPSPHLDRSDLKSQLLWSPGMERITPQPSQTPASKSISSAFQILLVRRCGIQTQTFPKTVST